MSLTHLSRSAAGAMLLICASAYAHVGETLPYRWTQRLHMSATHGSDSSTMSAWKVPVGTFNGIYDDSEGNPMAKKMEAPDSGRFTPLSIQVPDSMYPRCMRDVVIHIFDRNRTWYAPAAFICDSFGTFKSILAAGGETDAQKKGSAFTRALNHLGENCVQIEAAFTEGCGDTADVHSEKLEPALAEASGSGCSVALALPGDAPMVMEGVRDGEKITLPDFWYTAKMPHWDGEYLCPEEADVWSCGGANTIPNCTYYGLKDAWDKGGRNLPLSPKEIAETTAKGHEQLMREVRDWMVPNFEQEQIGAGYFSFSLGNLLAKKGGVGMNVSEWESEPAEARWTLYLDNTEEANVGLEGHNSGGSYGNTQVRLLNDVDKIRYLYCRYTSGTFEFLPKSWNSGADGYLTCAVWERSLTSTSVVVVSENIFYDEANPDSEKGLNLQGVYDDMDGVDDMLCAESEEGCASPFDEGGPGSRLIADHIVPVMGQWSAQLAVVDYISAPREAEAELTNPEAELRHIFARPELGESTAASIEVVVDAIASGDEALDAVKYGMSWDILSRQIKFDQCESPEPITMSQTWRWDASNSLGQLQWSAWRAVVGPDGKSVVGDVADASALGPNGEDENVAHLQEQGKYTDQQVSRSGVAIPLNAAMWVPSDWFGAALYLYLDYGYTGGAPQPLPSIGTARDLLFNGLPDLGVAHGFDGNGQANDAPYFALNPYNFPKTHPSFYEAVDGRNFDTIAAPLRNEANPYTLNHAFKTASYMDGKVSGDVYQTRVLFVCEETLADSVKECEASEETVTCNVVNGVEECTTETTCTSEVEYQACSKYSCRKDFCEWPLDKSGPGTWKAEVTAGDCAEHPAVKDYLEKGWLPPASAHGAEYLPGNSSHLLDYLAAYERAAIDAYQRARGNPEGYGETVPSESWGGHGRSLTGQPLVDTRGRGTPAPDSEDDETYEADDEGGPVEAGDGTGSSDEANADGSSGGD